MLRVKLQGWTTCQIWHVQVIGSSLFFCSSEQQKLEVFPCSLPHHQHTVGSWIVSEWRHPPNPLFSLFLTFGHLDDVICVLPLETGVSTRRDPPWSKASHMAGDNQWPAAPLTSWGFRQGSLIPTWCPFSRAQPYNRILIIVACSQQFWPRSPISTLALSVGLRPAWEGGANSLKTTHILSPSATEAVSAPAAGGKKWVSLKHNTNIFLICPIRFFPWP